MPRFTRLQVLNAIDETGLVPLFHHPHLEVVKNMVKACAEGGAKVFEFTNRGDGAFHVFRELEEYCASKIPGLMLGAGTVVDAPTAALYMNSGANFVVSPVLNPEIPKVCNRRKIPHIPGCGTLSEINQAEELGCEIIKVFPSGTLGGPAFVRTIKGPCPWSSLMPSGGVKLTEESLEEWFKAGVVCVGAGSELFTAEIIKKKDYAGLSKKVAQILKIISKVQGK